ncbi:hypothetical protein GMMP15_620002 [Candidatus Magnetomoraceae bacterium gMMP-15]
MFPCYAWEQRTKIKLIIPKYWHGYEMKLFDKKMEALGKYLEFEVEYLSAKNIKSLGCSMK